MSTAGYTSGVNGGQQLGGQRRLGRANSPRASAWLAGLAFAAAVLTGATVASAQDAPKAGAPKTSAPKAAAPKAKPATQADDLVPPAEEAPEAKAARGVVVIQRAGQPIGLGMVLGGDGRILTALSPLGSGNDLEAKFADDSTSKLKLGHHDRAWDLALLVPQSGKWTEGLRASPSDPLREDATIRAFSTGARGKPVATPVEVRSKRALIGGDDRLLDTALELGSKINARDLGAPLIDEKGRVVGLLGRACLPIEGKPCAPVAFGIPVSAVKGFLKSVPADAVPPSAWLGIQGVSDHTQFVKGVRVLSVAKGSPASQAKLRAGEKGEGDMIVAVDGHPVTTPDELAGAIKQHSVGEKVPLTLFSKGLYRSADVVLRAPPDRSGPASSLPPATQSALVTSPASAPPAAKKQKPRVRIKTQVMEVPNDAETGPNEREPFSDPL
ncbi:MAG TPA: S1C family serine protease [Polyangiaceae bacterium]|nr:S1C family serine protease [Polyangiaceae bacterium]